MLRTTTVRIPPCIAALTLWASPAGAVPITWTLSNVVFEDGSMAIGSFVYDADVGVYSDVSILTDRASYETGDLWEGAFPQNNLALVDGFEPNNLDGKPVLILIFLPGLTNLGGTVPLDVTPFGIASSEATCFFADCFNIGSPPGRKVVTGSVFAVPEPTSLALLGFGLTAIAAARRCRSASS